MPVPTHRPTVRVTAALTAAVAALVLAGCAGGSSDSSSGAARVDSASGGGGAKSLADGSAGSSGSPAQPSSGGKSSGASGSAAQQVSPASLRAAQQQLARRASVALEVKSISQAVARVRATTAASDGIILSENIGTTDGTAPPAERSKVSATTYGEITVSVPSDKLDTVVADLASVGTVLRSTTASEDVGSQIVDTQSRLETMRVSVARVRAFLDQAKGLDQVVTLEAELTRRESDLEALEAQLASLKDSVAMSPVQVSLTTQPEVVQPRKADTGFLAGLRSGWDAFTGSATVALTVVGAVLPFAVLLALVGLPVLVWLRRRRPLAAPPAALPQ
ncbi:DUF4349 domain-containing protein [Pedococcus sp. NPDC057267]|uniref:DUF4349 domain-containing protein n=1 Tax=Pedococcus sp. NPDC057267 TaxID=3346077 RepID=UPI003624CF6F